MKHQMLQVWAGKYKIIFDLMRVDSFNETFSINDYRFLYYWLKQEDRGTHSTKLTAKVSLKLFIAFPFVHFRDI